MRVQVMPMIPRQGEVEDEGSTDVGCAMTRSFCNNYQVNVKFPLPQQGGADPGESIAGDVGSIVNGLLNGLSGSTSSAIRSNSAPMTTLLQPTPTLLTVQIPQPTSTDIPLPPPPARTSPEQSFSPDTSLPPSLPMAKTTSASQETVIPSAQMATGTDLPTSPTPVQTPFTPPPPAEVNSSLTSTMDTSAVFTSVSVSIPPNAASAGENAVNNSIGGNTGTSTPSSTGVIAGVVVGGVALLLLSAVLIWKFNRRRVRENRGEVGTRWKRKTLVDEEDQNPTSGGNGARFFDAVSEQQRDVEGNARATAVKKTNEQRPSVLLERSDEHTNSPLHSNTSQGGNRYSSWPLRDSNFIIVGIKSEDATPGR